ncbi:MAG: hypothetical protein IT385_26750 [Deltaproteobacteria bacterium]|nr:hypothetical protein [Deltaproteobacteria bacterium]
MMITVGLVLALVLGGPPGPSKGPGEPSSRARLGDVARLKTTTARASQAAWMAIKAKAGTKAQLAAIDKTRALAAVCDDLVDLRALVDQGALGPGFAFRDNVRGRSWARPSLALVLAEAMKAFRAEHPGRLIAIGDVSQPGCGQLAHGVLVQTLRGRDAEALVARAGRELGEVGDVEIGTARDFPWEADRFAGPEQRVRVARRVLGWTEERGELVVRVGRTRHLELQAPTPEDVQAFEVEAQRLAAGALVERKPIETGAGPAVMSTWVDEGRKRQLVVVSGAAPKRRLDFADVREARLADWQEDKPGSRPNEVLWVRGDALRPAPPPPAPAGSRGRAPAPKPRPAVDFAWQRWALLYEAGHLSHLSGIDADLSYATRDNRAHFAVDLEAMDVEATFRWLELLDESARRLGTPIDKILVDAKVDRHLRRSLPMKGKGSKAKSRVWRLLARVGGHDAHHHLRLVEASAAREKAARKKLGLD